MVRTPKLSRRAFLVSGAAVGGGLAIGFHPFGGVQVVRAGDGAPEIGPWVVIRPDETVVVRIARSEMGQGTLTGLAQMVAEELECDWKNVTWEYPTPGENVARKRVWGDFGTGGSRGIRTSHDYVRKGGAAARILLVQAAADGWKVPASGCAVSNSVITHKASGRRTTYGKVAEAAARLEAPKDVPLKDPKQWKIIGKPLKRLDTADKLTGKQVYGADLKLPGMLNAAIKDSPVFGGRIRSLDAAKAEAMPGVKKVVRLLDTAVVVVADTWWHAKTALDAVKVEWDNGPSGNISSADIDRMLSEGLDADQAFVHNQKGDAKGAIAGAAKKVEAVYDYPYQNHACMEPMNATALYTADRCTVWCPTQNGEAALAAATEAAGLPLGKCDVMKLHLGGGFGRRGFSDFVTKAVLVAKEIAGHAREAAVVARGGHGAGPLPPDHEGAADGRPGCDRQPRRAADPPLGPVDPRLGTARGARQGQGHLHVPGRTGRQASIRSNTRFPNLKIDHAMRNTHVPPGFWRGVNINQNAIFLECFMDELAEAAGQDALEFRRRLMADRPKSLAVLNAVAAKGGWGKPAPKGRHRGLAHFRAFGSYVAALAEISVKDGNKVKVHRSSPPPTPAMRSTRRRSSARSPAPSSTDCRRCSSRSAPSRTAPSCSRTSTTTTRCASRRCRRWSPSSCPRAVSGAASASRRSASRRRRC